MRLDNYQTLIHKSRYARYLMGYSRRENWKETVERYCTFMMEQTGVHLFDLGIYDAIYNLEVMPSMRAMMTAGPALERDHVAGFNCAYVAIDDVKAFDESFFVLLNGTGVGYSVERQFINELPAVADQLYKTESVIKVRDSKLGWAKSLRELIALLYQGQIPEFDVSKVRPAGTPLKTFGGRACLTGDTIVYRDRKKSRGYNEVTIRDLFNTQEREKNCMYRGRFKKIKLRSLNEQSGTFFRNQLLEVIDNGVADVYEVITENGYRIKATLNHRFMDEFGEYKHLENFNTGDFIGVNGSKELKTGTCSECGESISRRAKQCKPCFDNKQIKPKALNTTARQRKQNRDYKVDYCEICGANNIRLETHHIDKNPHNNEHSNLEKLCCNCHAKIHSRKRTFGNPYSHRYLTYDKIMIIRYAGREQVFDLAMEGPNHNFIANGYVSHNSGPEPLLKMFKQVISVFQKSPGRKLNSLECHDIMCYIAAAVVVGGVRRCLPQNAMVATTCGSKAIKDIKPGNYVVTGGKKYKVLDSGPSGKKQLIKIKHEFGELECTPDHRVGIFNKVGEYTFIKASELKNNDCLVWDTKGYAGKAQKLPKINKNNHFNSNKITFPEDLDNDLAWLIGVIHGDGYIGERSIEISTNEDECELLHDVNSVLLNNFGLQGAIGKDSHNGKCIRLRVNSKELSDWFRLHIKQPNEQIRIPAFIMNSNRNNRFAYLSGLFDSDGRYRQDDNVIEQCTTIYKEFKNDIVLLLSSLGIACGVYNGSGESRRIKGVNAKDFYSINIKTAVCKQVWFNNVYDFSSSRKLPHTFICSEQRDFSYPVSLLEKHPQGYKVGSNITVTKLGLDGNIYQPSKILDLEQSTIEETWDIEVEDVNQFTSNGIVVHNSAMICLSNLSDDRMRGAKSGDWWHSAEQRQLANNSVCYTEKPEIGIFMKEWLSLYESKSGERGIFNRQASQRMCPERRDSEWDFGTNPCSEIVLRSAQFCVSGDTPLIHESGIIKFKDYDNSGLNIWNGKEWTPVMVRKTGTGQTLMRVNISDGSYLDCTPEHRWSVKDRFSRQYKEVMTKDLSSFSKYALQIEPSNVNSNDYISSYQLNSPYTLGFAVGDGCVYDNQVIIDTYGEKDSACPIEGTRGKKVLKPNYNVECMRIDATNVVSAERVTSLKKDPDGFLFLAKFNKEDVLKFVAGLADADGSETKTGGIRIYLSVEQRARNLQLLLTKYGIRSSVNLMQKAGIQTNLGVRRNDIWYLQITDCASIPCHRLDTTKGHKAKFKGKYQNIVSVEKLPGLHDTYCFNEPKRHMGLFANVLTYQCNLSEVVCRHNDTLETLARKAEIATIIGTCQASLTDFRYLRKVWQRNSEQEALLGVSMTGIFDCPVALNSTPQQLNYLRDHTIKVNQEYAAKIGINEAAAITCIKPSGCRPESELVTTDLGIYTLQELNPDQSEKKWKDINIKYDTIGSGNITKFYTNGLKGLVKIQLNFGMELVCTHNHQWKMSDGSWKKAGFIEPKDQIIIVPGIYRKKTNADLIIVDTNDLYCNIKKLPKQPSFMSNDLSWLVGYLWGDGCMSTHKKRLRFSDENVKNILKCKNIIKDLFGLDVEYNLKSDGTCYELSVGSAHLWKFFDKNGFYKYRDPDSKTLNNIPLRVRQSSKECILAFYAGIFDADGTYNREHQKACFTNTDSRFCKHFQDVAWSVGLCIGRSHNTKGGNKQKVKSMWLMNVSSNTSNDIWDILLKHSNKITGPISRQRIYKTGIVKSVNYDAGSTYTYDIETRDHWFYAGAVVSHNTVSQLVDSASGIHPRHSEYYIRRIRNDKKDPLSDFIIEKGIPHYEVNADTWGFEFPVKAPKGAHTRLKTNPLYHLDIWLKFAEHYCEHKPSATISIKDHEWFEVGAWVWKNFDKCNGISFLPSSDTGVVYDKMPYEDIDEATYNKLNSEMPKDIKWDELVETQDDTTSSQEFACVAGQCEL